MTDTMTPEQRHRCEEMLENVIFLHKMCINVISPYKLIVKM